MAYGKQVSGRKNGKSLWALFYSRYSTMPNDILKAMLVAVWHKMLK